MASEAALRKLETLSPREREVLTLRCTGLDYETIGTQLYIGENAVKTYMRRVYKKLELDHLRNPKSRLSVLNDVYCPALQSMALPILPSEPAIDEPEPEVSSVSDEVMQKVEEDERLLTLYRKPGVPDIRRQPERTDQPIIIRSPDPRPVRRVVWFTSGTVLGVIIGLLLVGACVLTWTVFRGPAVTPVANLPTAVPTVAPGVTQVEVTREVPVVVTATPMPVTDTPISAPTGTPTVARSPTQTPLVDTAPGTILDVGQSWEQNGISLVLFSFEFDPDNDDFYGQLYTTWKFANRSPNDIILTIGSSHFSAHTNQGTSLTVLGFYNQSFWCDDETVVVKASDMFDFSFLCGPGSSGYQLPIVVDLGNRQITEVLVTANDISAISGATWRIPIFH